MAGLPQALTALAHMRNPSLLSPSIAARISINTGPNAFYGEKYKVEKVMTSFTRGLFLTLYVTHFLIEGFRRRWQNYVWSYFCCIRFQTKETFHEWYVFLLTSKLGRSVQLTVNIRGCFSSTCSV